MSKIFCNQYVTIYQIQWGGRNIYREPYVGQKPTRACVVLLFKYVDYK
jgi:hypothetical protein